MSVRLLAGTDAQNDGAGLHPVFLSPQGDWSVGDPFTGAQNVSFGTRSARHDVFYFVDEQSDGAIVAARETDGTWNIAARAETMGEDPCYVALNPDETWLAVANYGSGSAALFRLDDRSGVPLAPPIVLQNSGSGRDEDRQEGPHAHCACFSRDGHWLYVVDLGADEILAFALDPDTGAPGQRNLAFRAPAGSGPRHLVFHPTRPLAILVSELASTLTMLDIRDGTLSARQTVSTLPPAFTGAPAFTGENLGGHLSLNAAGDRIYVTNRGHDSIAVFDWDGQGALDLLQHVPSGGASPRSFVLLESERQLVLANEQGCNITAFDILPGGNLSPRDTDLPLPGAVFLMVAPD